MLIGYINNCVDIDQYDTIKTGRALRLDLALENQAKE